jgi:stress-induced morphogen
MYEISVESKAFKGRRTVQQHRMVNEVIGRG